MDTVALVSCPCCGNIREILRWQVRDGSWIVCPCHKRNENVERFTNSIHYSGITEHRISPNILDMRQT